MATRTSAFFRGIASATSQKILTRLIGLAVTPIVLSYVDDTAYGIWMVIGSALGYIGLTNAGVTGASSAIAAKMNNRDEEHRINVLINNALVLQLLTGALVLLVGGVVSLFFTDVIKIGEYPRRDALLVFAVAVLGYGVSFPPKVFKGLLRARQRIALAVWLEFALFLLMITVNLSLLHLGMGLLALPVGVLVMQLVAYPLLFVYARKAYPQLRIDRSVVSWAEMKGLLNLSAFWFAGILAAMVIYSTDPLLIGVLLSTAAVTGYGLTMRLGEVMREWIYSINFTMMPAMGQLLGEGKVSRARDVYLRTQPVVLSLALAGAGFVALFNEHFVRFWVGAERYAGTEISLIAGGILFVSVVFHSSSLVISADLKVKGVTFVRLLEGALNVILSVLLARTHGLMGIALATLVAGVCTSFWFVPFITLRHLGVSGHAWRTRVLMRLGLVILALTPLSLGVRGWADTGTGGLILAVACYGIGAVAVIWFLAMDQQMRGRVLARA